MHEIPSDDCCCPASDHCRLCDLCRNELIEQKQSPDGVHRAVLFTRNCGATTGFNLQVAVLSGQQQLADANSLFIADDNYGGAASETRIAEIWWFGSAELLINHHPNARIFRQKSVSGVVRVIYERQPVTT